MTINLNEYTDTLQKKPNGNRICNVISNAGKSYIAKFHKRTGCFTVISPLGDEPWIEFGSVDNGEACENYIKHWKYIK